jgi:signal transduction histidine kinase/CHASE3 domain sensor protein
MKARTTTICLAVAGLLAILLASAAASSDLERTSRWKEHTTRVRITLRDALQTVVDAELEQRGYLGADPGDAWVRHQQTRRRWQARLGTLRSLASHSASQRLRLAEVERAGARMLDFLENTVAADRESVARGHLGPGIANAGEHLQALRAAINAMDVDAQRLDSDRTRDAATRQQLLQLILVAGTSVLVIAASVVAVSAGLARRREAEERERTRLAEQLALERERLHALVMQAPVSIVIWEGPEHRCVLFNSTYEALTDKRIKVGHTLLELFPELRGHPLAARLDRVYRTGEPDELPEELIPLLEPDGTLVERYFSTSWRAARDADGTITGVIAVGLEVTDQVHARRMVEASSRAAEAANRAKDEFLAMLGHELRNPLAPIKSAVDLMRLQPTETHERERVIIERQARHLMRLVDDLLDVSRIAGGKIQLQRAPVEVAEVITRALEVASPVLEERRHELSVDIGPALHVDGDAERLVQVLTNLLVNAAKYTPPGGRITLLAARDGTELVVKVRDSGQGITRELLPHVFDLFVQDRQDLGRSKGGLGLGLAIVRSLIELHGGRVSATSAGPGTGSEFTFRLPLLAKQATSRVKMTTPAQPSPNTGPPRVVIIVDDNEDAAELLSHILQDRGCAVHVAHDATTALQLADQIVPNLALLDIGLPGMDGYELAQRLRQLPAWRHVRLVALTGYGLERDRQRAQRAGFDEHLIKPVDLPTLQRIVESPPIA